MDKLDIKFLRASFEGARRARMKGNHPYGALLVDQRDQILMEAESTVITEMDCTGHAETNLMRKASSKYDKEFLGKCTIYTSTEPCPMCAGAIFWGNIKRVVFGLSEKSLYEMVGKESEEVLDLTCREIFGRGRKPIEVLGPLLEEEAREVHRDFWNKIPK